MKWLWKNDDDNDDDDDDDDDDEVIFLKRKRLHFFPLYILTKSSFYHTITTRATVRDQKLVQRDDEEM